MKNLKKWMFVCISFLVFSNASAFVGEVPLTILATGQILMPVQFTENSPKQFLILDASGENSFRSGVGKRLASFKVDSTASKSSFDHLKIGSYTFKETQSFKMNSRLNNRADLIFPDNCIGTFGLSSFKSKAIQINLRTKKMYIADAFEELDYSDNVVIVVFTTSFVKDVPVVNVSTEKYGVQQLVLDPSKPIAFNFAWNQVADEVKLANEDLLHKRAFVLNGRDSVMCKQAELMPVSLEMDAKVMGFAPVFMEQTIPCIGAEYLKNYNFTLDYNNAILYLDPISEKGKKETTQVE